MTNFLNRYEVDAGRPLDSAALHILTVVNRVALDLNLSYIVVGATARDLLLSNVFGFSITRATADVDFAVAVASWDRFRHIREALLASGEFSGGKIEHRIFLKTSLTTARIPVDLIPFGGISERGLIHWPPDWGIAMNVAGFEDAMAAALHVKVNDNLTIPIASLAGLAVLKLFAWFDRQSTSDKDALDLFRIISTYADAGNFDRIYVDEIRLIEESGHDLELAGAKLLGSDAHRICRAETLTKLRNLLFPETTIEKLAERIRISEFSLEPEKLPRIRSLLAGFAEPFTR